MSSFFLPNPPTPAEVELAAMEGNGDHYGDHAATVVNAIHALATYWGDGDPFVHAVGAGTSATGDPSHEGVKPHTGFVRFTTIRYCTGSADRCWLWPLSDFRHDLFPALDRVRNYWKGDAP